MTVDLRVAGKTAREASGEAAQILASVGVPGAENLDRIRSERERIEVAEARLGTARAGRDAAYARFEELAPGRRPSEVDDVIAEYETHRAARQAAEQAARQAAEQAAEAAAAELVRAPEKVAEPDVEAVEPVIEPTPTATEWWFGSLEAPAAPPAASAPVRALAERLSAEGREALARIEAQLAALDRVELARRSLEWHETNGSGDPAGDTPPEKS